MKQLKKKIFYGLFLLFSTAFFAPWNTVSGQNIVQPKDKSMKKDGAATVPDAFMSSLLAKYPQYFDSVIRHKNDWNVQIIYTQIDRDKKDKNKKVRLTDYTYNLNQDHYYYPASTVKLPIAILALLIYAKNEHENITPTQRDALLTLIAADKAERCAGQHSR